MSNPDLRLKSVAALIKCCNILADIGSDHAYLPIDLLHSGKINRAIITDINAGPLKNSKKNARKYHVSDKCEFIRGDGLDPLFGKKCDALAICGMGGDLIVDILRKNPKIAQAVPQIVLQPMTNQALLRRYLLENGYIIDHEDIVRDRHLFYQVISAGYTSASVPEHKSEFEYEFPRALIDQKNAVMFEFLTFKRSLEQKILSEMTGNSPRYAQTQARLRYIEERLGEYET